jgi:hypothetical protein
MHQLAQAIEPTDEEKVRRVLKTVVSMVAWLYREAEGLHMPFLESRWRRRKLRFR